MIFTGKCYDNIVISLKDFFAYVIEMRCCDDYLRLRTKGAKTQWKIVILIVIVNSCQKDDEDQSSKLMQ